MRPIDGSCTRLTYCDCSGNVPVERTRERCFRCRLPRRMQPFAAHLTLGAYEATERAQEEQVKNRFVPTEAWIEAFHAQYNGALTELIGRYAARRVSGTRKDTTSGGYARALVLRVLGDTLLGEPLWDPDTTPLADHLRVVIKNRTEADWDRAEGPPRVSLDVVTRDGRSPVRDAADRALRERSPDPRAAENAAAALVELRRRAAGDAEVLALIEAKARDAKSRAEVMRLTGFSEQQYRSARRRLNRIVTESFIQIRPRRKRNKGE
jgi:hypothetical protein